MKAREFIEFTFLSDITVLNCLFLKTVVSFILVFQQRENPEPVTPLWPVADTFGVISLIHKLDHVTLLSEVFTDSSFQSGKKSKLTMAFTIWLLCYLPFLILCCSSPSLCQSSHSELDISGTTRHASTLGPLCYFLCLVSTFPRRPWIATPSSQAL